MLTPTERGVAVGGGDFYIDPAQPVDVAVITHAHGDHARAGHGVVHCLESNEALLRHRFEKFPEDGRTTRFVGHAAGERFSLGDVEVSLHPAGHILGSAQVRLEGRGGVTVVSGDYKRAGDPTCAPFELVACDTFVTESTFALPIYRFPDPKETVAEIYAWWMQNRAAGRASVLYCYSLGKAQRILAELRAHTSEAVLVHGALLELCDLYESAGVAMLPREPVGPKGSRKKKEFAGRLVLAPPSVRRSPWVRRFGDHETGFASGWMQVRGTRRGRGLTRGFVLSDHADWPALLRTIDESGARRVLCSHGHGATLARYLRESRELDATTLATEWRGDDARYEGEGQGAAS